MSDSNNSIGNLTTLAFLIMLFGLLAVASHGSELLKQSVIAPGSSADRGIAADCRADELEEEQLSQEECELMVANVRIILSSSPDWYRPFQIGLSSASLFAALFSLVMALALINRKTAPLFLTAASIGVLLALDILGFIAALNIGPLLRAQYLFPLLMWIAIHLCMLVALIRLLQQAKGNT